MKNTRRTRPTLSLHRQTLRSLAPSDLRTPIGGRLGDSKETCKGRRCYTMPTVTDKCGEE